MSRKTNLRTAQNNKNDEFYTRLVDIEREVFDYRDQLRGKVILMPCDDIDLMPGESAEQRMSKFWVYFHRVFEHFGLKKIIATHYNKDGIAHKVEYSGGNDWDLEYYTKTQLTGDGDFRSEEIRELFKEADIIITNPPFSLFRAFIKQIIEFDKKFLILGNQNAITYKETFKLIKENKLWLGYTNAKEFIMADGTNKAFGNIGWFTNLSTKRHTEKLELWKKYTPEEFPKYDNYNAINVDKVTEIPEDYFDEIGVPITFLTKFNPSQFEIIALGNSKENFTPIKQYMNPMRVATNGEIKPGNFINNVLTIKLQTKPSNTVFYTDNDTILFTPYARLIIKRRYSNENNHN